MTVDEQLNEFTGVRRSKELFIPGLSGADDVKSFSGSLSRGSFVVWCQVSSTG